jgi:DNA-binding SARP family transcriptional activator/predicted negative regulator of RcsB-dependent stress response/energy-coupling factor transporter ATP-binding protein EcfA2
VASLTLKLLGHPEVELDGIPTGAELLRYQKAFALLVYLVLTGRPQSRQHLAELLWPELDESQGLSYLRGRAGLTPLRARLGAFLQVDRQTIAFDPSGDTRLDVAQFRALLGREASLDQLEEAVALYRDDFCGGFLPEGVSPEYEMWLFRWREQLRQQQMAALEQLLAGYSRWREYERALAHAERLLRMDPWLEGTHRWIMSLYAWQGQPERATAQYEHCRELLQAELGVEPTAATRQLHRDILQGALPRPRPIPYLAPSAPPHFVPREAALATLLAQLQPGTGLALVGMGGVGKSTLAAALARAARHRFPDGILWAHPEHTPAEQNLLTWSKFYDFDLGGLSSLDALQAAWRGITAGRRILVVLDGVTHADTARPLLPHGDGCALLLTTRDQDVAAALNARPFALEPLDTLAGCRLIEAILGERAVAESEAGSAICGLLEGLPLALEILAQRMRSRPQPTLQQVLERLQQIRSRLDLLAVGDRAVRASFELSWQMLDPPLQELFAALALFAGRPFHPDAVAALTGEPEAAWRLADLAALSLVQDAGGDYCRQHALLADFALEKLPAVGLDEATLERRLAAFYAAFVADHHAGYPSLVQEWANILAAMHMAHRHRDWQRLYETGRQMTDAWFRRARYTQAREAYRLSYDAARMLEDDEAVAQTLLDWGRACIEQGDYAEAQEHLDESLRLFVEHVGDPLRAAGVTVTLGQLSVELSRFEQAERLLLEAGRVFEQAEEPARLAKVQYWHADLAYRRNEFDRAQALCEAAAAHLEGEDLLLALNQLANIHITQARLDEAEQCLLRAQTLGEQLQDKAYLAVVDHMLGRVYLRQPDFERARSNLARCLEAFRQMGDRKSEAYVLYDLSLIAEQQADYARGIELAQECLDIFTQFDDTYNVMNTLVYLGDVYHAQKEDDQAGSSWRHALRLAESLGNRRYAAALQQRLDELR